MKINRRNTLQLSCLLMALFTCSIALAQTVEVNSAEPGEALQGTVNLDVTINGNGFDNSATVHFFKTGTVDPGGITVNSSRNRGSKKIIANIDVAVDADIDDFDIEVQMSGGRGGKGTTLFRVLQGNGGGQETWSFSAESSGEVVGLYESKVYTISGDDQNLVFNDFNQNIYRLSDFFIIRDYNGKSGEECFVSSGINRAGTMQLYDDLGNDADLVARLWFRASNDPADPANQIDDLKYVMELYDDGEGWAGSFPPNQAAWSVRVATRWELKTVRKGDARKDPCVSGDILAFPAESEGIIFRVIQSP